MRTEVANEKAVESQFKSEKKVLLNLYISNTGRAPIIELFGCQRHEMKSIAIAYHKQHSIITSIAYNSLTLCVYYDGQLNWTRLQTDANMNMETKIVGTDLIHE